MKVIIAGGRDFKPDQEHYTLLKYFLIANSIGLVTEIISGGCSGADRFGERFAKMHKIKTTIFPAEWKKYGLSAGPIRNEQMAKYADAAILFPGGKGTANMKKMAIQYGLKILYEGK